MLEAAGGTGGVFLANDGPALQIGGTYLIYSEVTYKYVPTVGYLLAKAGIDLSDVAYTRPRQNFCVLYNTTIPTSPPLPACPTL